MAGTLTISTLSDGTNSTSTTNCILGSSKAWINFDGTTGTIRSSLNFSSVTRLGGGSYTLAFTNAFADANYSVSCGGRTTNTTDPRICITFGGSTTPAPTTTGLTLYSSINNVSGDVTHVCCSIFR